jgi:Arabinose-binding domain of AraC transcription regulator, N-term
LSTFSIYQPKAESADQISDGVLAITVNAIRALRGSDWNPNAVLLPRFVPVGYEPYRRHFRATVRFNHENATVIFPARDLEQ